MILKGPVTLCQQGEDDLGGILCQLFIAKLAPELGVNQGQIAAYQAFKSPLRARGAVRFQQRVVVHLNKEIPAHPKK